MNRCVVFVNLYLGGIFNGYVYFSGMVFYYDDVLCINGLFKGKKFFVVFNGVIGKGKILSS